MKSTRSLAKIGSMSKYEDWINAGFKRLIDDFCSGLLKPRNESDIKCHLYHTLLHEKSEIGGLTQSHLVLSEWPCPKSQEAIDLAIVREKRGKKRLRPRLLIEIKETNKPERLVDSSARGLSLK